MPIPDTGQFVGRTFAAILTPRPRDEVMATLAEERFTGWVGPHGDGWCAAVPETPLGHVARGRQKIEDLAAVLASRSETPVLQMLVEADAVLRLWAGTRAGELLDYVSDVSSPDDEWSLDPFDNPVPPPDGPSGAERAADLARALGRPEVADELTELLLDDLGDSRSESERLEQVARLLGLPRWLVSVGSLPRDVPGGPRRQEFTRLRAGRGGLSGVALARASRLVRRRT